MSNLLHRIRLRRPWQREVLAGRVRWTRRFGCPGGLSTDEQVWLVFERLPQATTGSLNGDPIERQPLDRVDATGRLRQRNELCLETPLSANDLPTPDDESPGAVYLEIRRPGSET